MMEERRRVVLGVLPSDEPSSEPNVIFTVDVSGEDDWQTRVDPEPHLEVIGPVGAAYAVEVLAELTRAPGWAVRCRFEPRDGVLALTQEEKRELPRLPRTAVDFDHGTFTQLPPDNTGTRALTRTLIRQIGLGDVENHVKELLTHPVVRTKFLGPAWQRPKLRRGHSQRNAHTYALWANRYVWARKHRDMRSPIKAIIAADEEHGVIRTERQVRGMVNRARDANLLTRPTADGALAKTGRAGGELTDTARRLLAELDVAEESDHIVPTEWSSE